MRAGFVLTFFAIAACANGDVLNDDQTDPTGDVDAGTVSPGEDASLPPQAEASAPEDTAPSCGAKTLCSGACVDTQSDGKNCGKCGNACPAGQSCVKGACLLPCDAGLAACGSACVDTQTDLANCGKCQNACPGAAAATCAAGACKATLRVRALIDGTSDLVFTGSNVHWHHIAAAAPGLWNGNNQPTYLNTAPWMPGWPGGGENRDCNCDSQSSTPAIPPLGARDQTVALQIVAARGSIVVTQQPASTNGYTLRVELSDPPGGADWYELVLTYATQ
jgi:hypothetical protein